MWSYSYVPTSNYIACTRGKPCRFVGTCMIPPSRPRGRRHSQCCFVAFFCGSNRNHYYLLLVLVMRPLATSISTYVCTYLPKFNKQIHYYDTYRITVAIFPTTHPQFSSARLYIAQQRSAAQCGAAPCPLFCGAASCGAVRSWEHTAAVTSSSCSTRYDTDTRFMYVFCVLVFLRSSYDCPLSVPMPPPPPQISHVLLLRT